MKNTRKMIPAIAMLLISAVMLTTASYAWFTMGSTATAEGMQVKATASSTLLISKTNTVAEFTAADGSIEWTDDAKALLPATHYDATKHTLADGQSAPATGLVTVDSTKVTAATGAYTGNYSAVDTGSDYYIDYVAYLGASGAAMTGKNLTATISITEDIEYLLHNAVSIDFIVDLSTADDADETPAKNPTFNQTVNLKTVDASSNPGANKLKVTLAQGITIPQALVAGAAGEDADGEGEGTDLTTGEATLGDSIMITMRVYFDGALEQSTGNYYVRNALAVTDAIGFRVQFDAE